MQNINTATQHMPGAFRHFHQPFTSACPWNKKDICGTAWTKADTASAAYSWCRCSILLHHSNSPLSRVINNNHFRCSNSDQVASLLRRKCWAEVKIKRCHGNTWCLISFNCHAIFTCCLLHFLTVEEALLHSLLCYQYCGRLRGTRPG